MLIDFIVKEQLKQIRAKVAIFLAGALVGTFLGNVWFNLQMMN
jgi:flagellar motor component MotA